MRDRYDCDTIRDRIKISDYLAERGVRIRGKRAVASWRGGDGYSVAFNDEKGTWHDFVTGDGGSVIDLAMTAEHYEFSEAVHVLGRRFNLPCVAGRVPTARPKPPQPPKPSFVKISQAVKLDTPDANELTPTEKALARKVTDLCDGQSAEALNTVIDAVIKAYYIATGKGASK